MDLVKDLYGNGKLYRLSMDPSGIDISGETQILRINSDKITGDLNIDGNVEINGNSNFDGNVEINGNSNFDGNVEINGNSNFVVTNNFVVANSGNVGIGASTPETPLHIKSTTDGKPPNIKQSMGAWYSSTSNVYNYCEFTNTNESKTMGIEYDYYTSSGITNTTTHTQMNILSNNGVAGTEIYNTGSASYKKIMSILSNGNVGIGTASPSEKLEVNGKIKVPQNQLQDGTNIGGVIPSGGIIMWHGSTVPNGWALCNGQNGTPNLLDRFILGSSTNASGGTGGNHSVTLTKDQIPSHNHSANMGNPSSNHRHSYTAARNYNCNGVWSSHCHEGNIRGANNGNHNTGNVSHWHTHSISVGNTGGGNSFDNRPAYYKLAYIMKL